jgi:hypothetical protein
MDETRMSCGCRFRDSSTFGRFDEIKICAQGGSTAVRIRWHLDDLQGLWRHKIRTDPRTAFGVRVSYDPAERRCRADPSERHAGHSDLARRI